jgi:hypothetical protein
MIDLLIEILANDSSQKEHELWLKKFKRYSLNASHLEAEQLAMIEDL